MLIALIMLALIGFGLILSVQALRGVTIAIYGAIKYPQARKQLLHLIGGSIVITVLTTLVTGTMTKSMESTVYAISVALVISIIIITFGTYEEAKKHMDADEALKAEKEAQAVRLAAIERANKANDVF